MRVYVTKSVSVDSIRNDIDAKKDRQQGFERMPHDKKKKGDQKTNKKQDKEKTKMTKVKQTDFNKQPFQNKLVRKTKEICNNGDRDE